MHFKVFSLGQGTYWGYFLGLLKFQIFLGCLKFLIFLGVNSRCWARPYVLRKNESYPHPPWDTQPLLFNKYTLLQRSSVYTKKLKRLVGLAGWLIDWLRRKQTDSSILLRTALKHTGQLFGGVAGVGALIWPYISSSGPLLEVQILNFIFLEGRGVRKNKYVLGYDEIMDIFLDFLGSHFYTYKGFLLLKVQNWKMFWGR